MENQKIAFLDSGVGGLSVFMEVKKLLPKENYIIFADQKNNPYGEKSQEQIKKFVNRATKFLTDRHSIKIIVLACNTATVMALDDLRKKFNIPIVGVVPAIKPATALTRNKKIAVMSTPVTAKSPYLRKLIDDFANGLEVLKLDCAGLQESIEISDEKTINHNLEKYAAKIKEFNADVIVLGCTHYPLLKKQIEKYFKGNVKIIDSGAAIARRIKKILEEQSLFSNKKSKDIYFTTGDPNLFSSVASKFLGYPIKAKKAPL